MGVPRDQWPVRESGLAVWVVRIGSWGIAETPRVDEAALVIDGAKALRRAVTDVCDHPVGSVVSCTPGDHPVVNRKLIDDPVDHPDEPLIILTSRLPHSRSGQIEVAPTVTCRFPSRRL
jgi:hypothetical protein